MPSIRQLEYLLALKELRHFRRAAERVGVSQPTLSAQLKNLEERLGVQLVERGGTAVVLTAAGDEIATIAERVLVGVNEIRDRAASYRGAMSGVIRLGLSPTVGPHLLPRAIPRLHAAFPELRLHLREEPPQGLTGALQRGTHDLLLMPLPVRGEEMDSDALFREPLYLVVPAGHALARKGWAAKADLAGEAVLALGAGYQLHEQVNALCQELGARILYNYEGTSLATLHQMVGMGLGISLLPGLYVRSQVAGDPAVAALELRDRSIYRTIGLVWRKSSARLREFAILGEHLKATVRQEFPEFLVHRGPEASQPAAAAGR